MHSKVIAVSTSHPCLCIIVPADWQESFRAESPEVLAPLLDKTDASNAASSSEGSIKSKSASTKHETETVKALLSMSAVDTPLLMLAFAAGKVQHSCIMLQQHRCWYV